MLCGSVSWSADKIAGSLTAKDALAALNRPATLEARLVRKGMAAEIGLGGEPLELAHNGQVVAKSMTGGDGRAVFQFTPKTRGMNAMTVRVGESPRVTVVESSANIAAWEQRTPILGVEVAALMEEAEPPSLLPPVLPLSDEKSRKPLPDAADELTKLSQFYYNIVYVAVAEHDRSGGFATSDHLRAWLKEHKFPSGYILVLTAAGEGVGAKLDELRLAGWKTLKIGIGRSKAFADAFLERRLEAIVVPEPAKGEIPRKAKLAKEWKDVRKKL
jgi:hypothetical protein